MSFRGSVAYNAGGLSKASLVGNDFDSSSFSDGDFAGEAAKVDADGCSDLLLVHINTIKQKLFKFKMLILVLENPRVFSHLFWYEQKNHFYHIFSLLLNEGRKIIAFFGVIVRIGLCTFYGLLEEFIFGC